LKRLVLRKTYSLLFILFLLGACTGVTVKEPLTDKQAAYQDRSAKLADVVEWSLLGRISLDDGDQGGSGRLQWDVKTDNSELDFHGAMGRGAWHLDIGPEAATLKEANGTEQTAPDVNGLVQDNLGWHIPMDALHWWVRGMSAPGASEEMELDPDGLLKSLDQLGWKVSFSRYESKTGFLLPRKLIATRDDYRVKLAISRWQMGINHASQH
jgi:outer membrane lipoprotein LolB